MKVLITGISGLLGSRVARDAYEAGYEIVGVSRNISNLKFEFPVKTKIQDLTDDTLRDDLLAGIDIVIRCAADTHMGSFHNPNQNLLNTKSVKNLIDSSIKFNVKRFILVSSANTCIPGVKNRPGTEENKLEVSSANLNYINSKIKAERIVLSAFQNNKLDVIIINPTFILNPLIDNQSSNKLLDYCLRNSILFYPRGGKNVVDARDVSKAIIVAINNGEVGGNYILSNKNYTYKEFFKLVLKEQKRRAILIPLPASLLLLFGGILTMIEYVTRTPINFNLNSAKLLNSNHYYDYSKAAKHLKFKPRDIHDTIKTKLDNAEL